MTIATVKAVAARFLKSNKHEVLALKGAWGVGKTYAWNKLVLDHKDMIRIPNYCYVSLFGVSTIAELRTAIFTKTQAVKRLGVKLDAQTINSEWLSLVGEQTKRLLHFGSSLFKELPYGKNVTVGFETLAPHFIRNTIICLDDFERLTKGTIRTEEILGLISELKEEKGCKIILIFNEEKLSNKEIYAKYREKVVDIELLYDPTPKEASDIALPDDLPCRASIEKYCISLAVKNIRVLRKIVGLLEIMHEVAGKLHPKVMEQAAHSMVLFAWCYFDSDGKKPTFQFLREWNSFTWALREQRGEVEDPNHTAWTSLLQTYGLTHLNEFDLAIFNVIERGYLEETGFVEAAQNMDAQFRAQDVEQSFTNAWDLFHNTFADNREELIHTLYDSFKKSVKHITPINLEGTTELLRELDRGELADELIDFYLDARATDKGILDLDDNPFSGEIKDPVIWERFNKRKAETKLLIPLSEAVMNIAEHGGWSNTQIEALQAASEDDFYALFKQDHGDELSRMIGCCLQFENREEKHKPIGEKARTALIRIGKENPLNAIRVRRHKVVIDNDSR